LCARHGISRKTGYKWLARCEALGAAGLLDRSSAPRSSVSWLSASVIGPILALRRARPSWGPGKLLARLSMDHPDQLWPAASTVGDLLVREGLVTSRQYGARATGRSPNLLEPLHSNDSCRLISKAGPGPATVFGASH
jgi:putative transposase